MKKIIVIITILLSSITANAQEKQNDATWEETITFLKEYIVRVKKESMKNMKTGDLYRKYDMKINGQELTAKIKTCKKSYVKCGEEAIDVYIVDLKYITGVSSMNDDGTEFELYFENNSFKQDPDGFDEIIIANRNVELNKRLAKAFKHLAYLAKEKRKQSKF